MLYFSNQISNEEKERILKLLDKAEPGDMKSIQSILNDNNIEFASLIRFEDDSVELVYNNDYLFLTPLGGIAETKGKYDEFYGFDCDFDAYEATLSHDLNAILSGEIGVINLGK